MKKKGNREKRKLIKRGKNGEPTIIEFNLSKAVIITVVIVIIIVRISTVIEAREESSLEEAEEESSESGNVTWVDSKSYVDGSWVVDEDDEENVIKVPVPDGYVASQIPGETSVNTGFVIYEDTAEGIDWKEILVDEVTSSENAENEGTSGEETPSDETDNGNATPSTSALSAGDTESVDYGNENSVQSNENEGDSSTQEEKGGDEETSDEGTGNDGTGDEETSDDSAGNDSTEDEETSDEGTGNDSTGDEETSDEGTGNDSTGDEETSDEGTGNDSTGDEETSDEGTGNDSTGDEETSDEGTGNDGTSSEGTDSENTVDDTTIQSTLSDLSSDNEEETTVTDQEQKIYDLQTSTNQYVWVPVNNITRIYGVDSNGKLWGKLYNFPTSSSGERSALNWIEDSETSLISITAATGYTEPNITLGVANTFANMIQAREIDSRLQSLLDGSARYELLKELEENFQLMIKSIKEYGGFYIGRYETGGLSGTAVVQKMNEDIDNQIWYTMYEKCKELKGENDNVITSMIWGCLWDETLQWLIDSEATISDGTTKLTYYYVGSNSTSWGNHRNATFSYIPSGSKTPEATATKSSSNSGEKIPTGSAEYTKVNNIYDLAGNILEMTLEGYTGYYRVGRARAIQQ